MKIILPRSLVIGFMYIIVRVELVSSVSLVPGVSTISSGSLWACEGTSCLLSRMSTTSDFDTSTLWKPSSLLRLVIFMKPFIITLAFVQTVEATIANQRAQVRARIAELEEEVKKLQADN